jgi:hypothetical protein
MSARLDGRDAERDVSHTTVRTDEPVLTSHLFEIFSTSDIIPEKLLKFWKRLREWQRGILIDVHHDRRWCIERMFCILKNWRRIATRYDRLARNSLSAIALVASACFWLP